MNNKIDKEEDICWYHANLSRTDAEALLLEEGRPEGSFLVRESNSSSGDYVLSVLYLNQVTHFQIRRHTEDVFFSIDENIKIHGLESLVEHYIEEPGILSEGLVLTKPVKGDPPPHNLRRHGWTNLLHRATSAGSFRVVVELLKSGYNHEAKNQDGQTAVHLASIKGNDDILKELIDIKANVNPRDTAGYTPLHYACVNNFPSAVRILVQEGNANIQARNTTNGFVPLHEAAARGHVEVVRQILSLNAPVNPRTQDGRIPSQLARENGYIECAEVLENYQCPAPRTSRTQWYHGTLDRAEAEDLIRRYCRNNVSFTGTFLVRWSDRNKGAVLTLLSDDKYYNYIIRNEGKFYFIDDGPYLNSLEHVVDYYSFISDGLPTVLKTPVPPKTKPPVPDFSTIPRPKKKGSLSLAPEPEPYNDNDNSPFPSQLRNISFTSTFSLLSTNNNDDIENYIPFESLKLEEELGVGEFGSVFRGTYTKYNDDVINVAVKTLRNEQVETNRGSFLSEAQVMMKLNHHCIVQIIGLSMGPSLLMVQELAPLGSLLDYLLKNQKRVNPNYEFKVWAAQIACGMKYLEEQRFVHRDLAARNILLATQHQAKISDFGLSRALNAGHEYYKAMQGGKWPLKWYAPESFNYGNFSHQSDVWSFGVTIWEMYSFGEVPYGDLKGSEAIELIQKGSRLEQPDQCPNNVYQILRQCWSYDPKQRPTFCQLLEIFTQDTDYMNIRELIPEANLA